MSAALKGPLSRMMTVQIPILSDSIIIINECEVKVIWMSTLRKITVTLT